jgi:hypothetical protein
MRPILRPLRDDGLALMAPERGEKTTLPAARKKTWDATLRELIKTEHGFGWSIRGHREKVQLTRRHDDGVVAFNEFGPGDVDANVHTGTKSSALCLHLGKPLVNVMLFHLEVRNAVAQEAADAVVTLKHRDCVADTSELLSGGQPGGTTAHNRDSLVGDPGGRKWGHPPVRPGLLNDGRFHLLDGHGRLVDSENTRGLTRSGAELAGEFREIVGFVEPLNRPASVPATHQVIPFRNEVA